MQKITISHTERRATLGLALIFAFRMLGLFMILPVFALYAHKQVPGATPFLIGLALGIYGLTQCLLQIPFGMLSDKLGRKRVIAFGLALFALGSIVAAKAHSMDGLVIGRALQGAGAIGSTILALVADLTREEKRTKAMAMIGMTIGLTFSIAFILGPILGSVIGVSGIFWLTALFALCGIVILFKVVPTPLRSVFHRDTEVSLSQLGNMLKNKQLLRLDFGIFTLHAILTASFIAIPITLEKMAGIHENQQWLIYLPVLVFAFIAMVPFIIIAEKKRKMKNVFVGAILILSLTQIGLFLGQHSVALITLCLFVFFTAFTLLEASLPSLISKIAPTSAKGTAMGIYSSAQFFGIFVGGTLGGLLFTHFHQSGIFAMTTILALLWFLVAKTMAKPPHYGTHMLQVGKLDTEKAKQLSNLLLTKPGVAEVVVLTDDSVAYLKVDNQIVDKALLLDVVTQFK